MRIEEDYVRTGYFWLPKNKDKKIPGTLTISDGGEIELEIVGLFDEEEEGENNDCYLNRIIGHVETDGLVTLDNCYYENKNIAFGGISKSRVFVHRVLSGAAYESNEPFTFNSLSFRTDCIDEWLGIRGISIQSGNENKKFIISYEHPKNITYQLDNGMQLEICFGYNLTGIASTTEAKITQKAYFKLISEVLRPLSDFTDTAFKLTNLMCFAVDDTVSLKNLVATSSEIQIERDKGESYSVPIKIYFQSTTYSVKISDRNWHDMLFNYKTIKPNAQIVFNNWIKAYDIISPALNLYFSTKNDAQRYLDGKFLALSQGLETYHRRTSETYWMEPSEYQLLVSEIIEACPEEQKTWLKGRLMHGNEINLRKRLKLIIEPFKARLGNSRQREKLIKSIVDTRNYLTHYNEDLMGNAAKGSELGVLCRKMEVIFQLNFLEVIGFDEGEINSVVENSYPLKQKIQEA